jgi:glutamate racemase
MPDIPTGTKSAGEIEARVPALLGRMSERFDPELIVIACNTASTIALDAVRAALDVPIVGTVPAIRPAAERSRTRVIGVLGTHATVRQPYVDRLSEEFRLRLPGSAPWIGRSRRPGRSQAAR